MKNKIIGLTRAEVDETLNKYGDNSLTQPPQETFLHKFIGNFKDPIIEILIFALIINFIFVFLGYGDWIETVGIFIAIVLATFISTYSEHSNENAFQKLQEEASKIDCKVIREGKANNIFIDSIVKGDAIILQAGDKVPADGILLEGDIKVDQAVLNGESKEADKVVAAADFKWEDKIDFLDENRVYRGAVVVEGQAIMQAVNVGDSSVYGKLTQELKDDDRESPLKLKLTHLADKISKVGYTGGFLIAIAVMIQNVLNASSIGAYFSNYPILINDLIQAIILAIIIIVMAVPEGLPLMIAIVSFLNMGKMLRDNVLVRKLVGIETAGSLNLLFTDKTGTITKGKLEVVQFITGEGNSYKSFEELPSKIKDLTYANCLLNTSAIVEDGKVVGGNLTEYALGIFLGEYENGLGLDKIKFVPFNSKNKYSWLKVSNDSEKFCLIKGAPEKLIKYADFYLDKDGNKKEFTKELKANLENQMLELANRAIRMLGLFTYDADFEGEEIPTSGLVLTGITGIRDEVRTEAIFAIEEVNNAGVQVVMITGDRRETALAIAKDAKLVTSDEDLVWTSDELGEMSDDYIKEKISKLRVVARALPMDKSRLVRIAQEMNFVVGMTGDGVNDAPALKKADVGFAMGSGTEVAKEAGDIVILDDNFLSIKQAILYGRTIYNSICKFIVFQLTINFSAVAINFIAPFVGIDKPLTIIQILWINLVMDTFAALAFGGEPALEQYLEEKPKRRNSPIISRKMGISILTNGIYMTVIAIIFYKSAWIDDLFRSAPDHIYTYTGFFCAYIFMAVANGFSVRTDGFNLLENIKLNKGFVSIMSLIIVVQVLLTFFGGEILRLKPLTLEEWGVVIIIGISVIFVDLIKKMITK